MRPIDVALIARADSIAAPMAAYPVEWLDPALVAPMMAPTTHGESWTSLHLPRPDRWTALLATLGLVAFFFLRRIV